MKKLSYSLFFLAFISGSLCSAMTYNDTNFVFFNDTNRDIDVIYTTCDRGCSRTIFDLASEEPSFGFAIADNAKITHIKILVNDQQGNVISSGNFSPDIDYSRDTIAYSIGYASGIVLLNEVDYKRGKEATEKRIESARKRIESASKRKYRTKSAQHQRGQA